MTVTLYIFNSVVINAVVSALAGLALIKLGITLIKAFTL